MDKYMSNIINDFQRKKAESAYTNIRSELQGINERLSFIDDNLDLNQQISLLEQLSNEFDYLLKGFIKNAGIKEFEDTNIYQNLEEQGANEDEMQSAYEEYINGEPMKLYDKINSIGDEIKYKLSRNQRKMGFVYNNNYQRPNPKNKFSFSDRIIITNKDELIRKLREMIVGKKGKDVVMIIQAAIKKGVITKPTFSEVKSEFGDIGNKSGYDKYMNRYGFKDEELNPIIDRL